MEDTLHSGEYLVVSDLFYTPKRGDIVVFQDMTVAEPYRKPLVKRIIATEGETVEINFNTWELKIDGEVVDESAFRQLKNDGSPVTATLEGYDRLTNRHRGTRSRVRHGRQQEPLRRQQTRYHRTDRPARRRGPRALPDLSADQIQPVPESV